MMLKRKPKPAAKPSPLTERYAIADNQGSYLLKVREYLAYGISETKYAWVPLEEASLFAQFELRDLKPIFPAGSTRVVRVLRCVRDE